MIWHVPQPWEFVLLALAAYRLTRLVGWDSITEPARARIVRRADHRAHGEYRARLDEFLHCPFCVSWWLCLAGFVAWQFWPHAVDVIAVPWAASGVVGLISKNWDA